MDNTDILSIQLYTLRSLGDLDRVLDTVKQAGYGHVETVGSHLDDAENVRTKLDARGLKVSSSHVSLAAVRERPGRGGTGLPHLGLRPALHACCAVGSSGRAMPRSGARLGRELGEIAERMREHGIAFGYHNHDWELAPKDGAKTALELIFEAAEDSPLAWQVDVAWLVRGGADPKEWMQRYRDRSRLRTREGYRAAGTKRGPGRLGGCRRRRAGLAGPLAGRPGGGREVDGGGARQARRSRGDRACQLRFHQPHGSLTDHGTHRHRHHRLRQHQPFLSERARRGRNWSGYEAVADLRMEAAQSESGGVRRAGRHRGPTPRRSGHPDRHQPHRSARPRAGQSADCRSRQARLFGEAAR